MITSLTRTLKGHWATTETGGAWLADLVLDLSAFAPGSLQVMIAYDIVVQAGSQGVVALGAGGAPETLGDTGAANGSMNGPFDGRTYTGWGNCTATAGPDILHLIAESQDGQPVEISNVVVTIRDNR